MAARYVKQLFPWTCAMVAALNAAKFYGLPTINQRSRVWQDWIDHCDARYRGAARPDLLWDDLGLVYLNLVPEKWAIKSALANNVPVQVHVVLRWRGSHAVLILPGKEPFRVCGWCTREKAAHPYERLSLDAVLKKMTPIGPNRRAFAIVTKRCTDA